MSQCCRLTGTRQDWLAVVQRFCEGLFWIRGKTKKWGVLRREKDTPNKRVSMVILFITKIVIIVKRDICRERKFIIKEEFCCLT
jgi:hypothetical protein